VRPAVPPERMDIRRVGDNGEATNAWVEAVEAKRSAQMGMPGGESQNWKIAWEGGRNMKAFG